ncbi:MutS family DNA mismatch repair protein [Parabacteroides distasonis]|uniref:MutS family DNA mismatch repair protein n=3 Tax=Parabacteroides distasonis TaxID=823 RepID=UPI00189EA899|nr:MutS family DNA mismatch repair protein [Parabacteroides distasonis]MDB9151979.1 DNA mismatch repair protein MutS [Parabacteroides distasonis]MDB9156534.1 DNA mismatch repair protein MutS [Parabacteroides distasonis]MDB9165661.1 DNA mismatch repair protein MutS [Parabacteroides distasonis]MDB9170067.1 DNA mismatch repair protein MutS [Parabacteroides distasonis]
MEEIYSYYKENIDAYTRRLGNLKKKIHLMGSIRLALVAGAILSLWIFRDESWQWLTGITFAYIIPFALLMWYHNKMYARKVYAETLIKLNEDELKGLDYDFSAFDGAVDKISGEHSFCLDLDVFGDRSLFQSLNRTVTGFGRERLAGWLSNPLTDKKEIVKRQQAVKELAALSALRQHFYVTGIIRQDTQDTRDNDINFMDRLTQRKHKFVDSLPWKLLIWAVPVLWIVLGIAYSLDWISGSLLNIYFLITLVIAYGRAKEINALYATVNKMESIFNRYSKLMQCVEEDNFQSEELKEISGQLANEKELASHAIKRLSSYIGGLDQRFSLAGIIFNLFYLRDTRHAILLERWIQTYSDKLPLWFDALARFDALNSLGGFAFNHPEYIYPEIADTYFQMEGKALGHPLLNREVCVKNDIDIRKSPWFLIITGANMAGKSTYLRTIGVNYLLACVGAPVCAASLTVYPAHMVTSLRTSDSLASNESYFFAELKRLKMIIDRLQNGEKLFIILDEILKGTNSIDKQKGSLALMKQLVAYKACGIIATHDLVLGTLEEEFPEQIKNYRFEADIKNEELSFSYQLREGIAQNMNACFLMNKMGILFN